MSVMNLPPDFMAEWYSIQRRLAALETIAMQTLTDGSWQDVSFTAGYSTSTGLQPCQVAKDQNGQVHIRGVVTTPAPPVSAETFAVVPVGFRPTEGTTAVDFPVVVSGSSSAAPAILQITTAGNARVVWDAAIGTGSAMLVLGHQTYR